MMCVRLGRKDDKRSTGREKKPRDVGVCVWNSKVVGLNHNATAANPIWICIHPINQSILTYGINVDTINRACMYVPKGLASMHASIHPSLPS
jgi:hypothetical protein